MKTYKKVIYGLLILCLVYFGAAIIVADDDTEVAVTDSPQATTTPLSTPRPVVVTTQDKILAQELSNTYHITVSAQEIADIRVNNDLGYGGITLLYGLAYTSGNTITDILAMRQEDLGWGDIAKSLGLKVSDIMKKSSSVLKSAKMDREEKKLQNELDKKPINSKQNTNSSGNGNKKQDNTGSGNKPSHNTNNSNSGNSDNNSNTSHKK